MASYWLLTKSLIYHSYNISYFVTVTITEALVFFLAESVLWGYFDTKMPCIATKTVFLVIPSPVLVWIAYIMPTTVSWRASALIVYDSLLWVSLLILKIKTLLLFYHQNIYVTSWSWKKFSCVMLRKYPKVR